MFQTTNHFMFYYNIRILILINIYVYYNKYTIYIYNNSLICTLYNIYLYLYYTLYCHHVILYNLVY